MLYDEDLDRMIDEGMSVEEIADKFSGDECVDKFGIESDECHEDSDCNTC